MEMLEEAGVTTSVNTLLADAIRDGSQIKGVLITIGWAGIGTLIAGYLVKLTIGLRVDEEAEVNGLDTTELGMEAYPEFGKGSQTV